MKTEINSGAIHDGVPTTVCLWLFSLVNWTANPKSDILISA